VIALVVFAAIWARRTPALEWVPTRLTRAQRRAGVLLALGTGLVVALIVWIRGILRGHSPIYNELVFYTVTIGLAAAGLASVIICVVWWTVRRPRLH
jgi:hypothetical protein